MTQTRYAFLVETYATERLKTLGVWAQIPDARMRFRPEPRARSPLEHMVHQCVSEDTWMRNMLGIAAPFEMLPVQETRLAFLLHYAAASGDRDRKSTRLNSSHVSESRMPSSA